MRFVIESCHNAPIYNRIAVAFCIALKEMGHEVLFIDPRGFDSNTFVNTINELDIDYYISTNGDNFIQQFDPVINAYLFNKILHKKIFIHHDAAVAGPGSAENIFRKYKEFSLANNTSFHFCIERSTIFELKKFGISNSYLINHASEFTSTQPYTINNSLGASFIGHLTADLTHYPIDSILFSHHILAATYCRISNASYHIQHSIRALSEKEEILNQINCSNFGSSIAYQILMHEVTKVTLPYRAEIFKLLYPIPINIIGGDLSNGTNLNSVYRMSANHIQYHPPTTSYNQASEIYQNSKVNINLSSLQFDTAINNRIIDVISSGGFILTDLRSDLIELVPAAREICFETPEELKDKVSFYLNNDNDKRYYEIIDHLKNEFSKKFSYVEVLNRVLLLSK